MFDRYDSILVGGSGFVGTQLGLRLAGRGERVLNLSRHHPKEPTPGVDFSAVDFGSQKKTVHQTLPRTDSLVILIGQIGPDFDPAADRRALKAIIDLVNVQKESMKVLYCSTVLVYGDCEAPAQESDSLSPVEPYAQHKAENESLLKNLLAKRHHLGILRIANVFGDIRSRGFVSLVMNRILVPSSGVFRVNGDGKQERDYIYVDDLAEAIDAVKSGLDGWDTVNVSTGTSRTLLAVIDAVQSVCKKDLPFEVTQQSVAEASKIRISNGRLREVYAYAPRHTFEKGLALMWNRALAVKLPT